MPYSVEGAISSSALFDMSESDKIFREQGLIDYKEDQRKNIDEPLEKGVAFPFVSRLRIKRANNYRPLNPETCNLKSQRFAKFLIDF